MGWEKDRYYTRSRKVNGRVVREYIGGGEVGALVAQMDAVERERREWERECWRLEKEEMEAFDSSVAKVCQMADIIAKAAMVAAGFHRHRGEWRRRRVQEKE
ncbi:MAG: hypothetical protein O3C40_19790 [Planctomycetota bacterium]|nr:hypothetical protein [Planctomycetota bacterium]